DWQTLIVGLAAVAALIYAGRQLQIERGRDRRAYLLQHTSEWEALEALEADLMRFRRGRSPVLGALMLVRSGYLALSLDRERWHRLNVLCVAAIDAPVREYLAATSMYNDLIHRLNTGTDGRISRNEESWIEGHLARVSDTEGELLAAINRRRTSILALAPAD
ncbi:MAG: hypothetical protein ACOH2M_17175, partial [Cypionkella sp.]